MTWQSRYIPPDPIAWQGRVDMPTDSCFFQHMRLTNLLQEDPLKTAPLTFALLGFKCDEGVGRDLGRTGAFDGPTAIRQSLSSLPIQRTNVHCYDAGNIVCTDHDLEASQVALGHVIAKLLAADIRPIVLGGGHEVAWGNYLGIRTTHSQKTLGIINFDAHFDMNPMYPNFRASAKTPFFQIAKDHQNHKLPFDYNCIGIQDAGNIRQAFEVARANHTKIMLADDLHQGLQEKCFDFVDRVADHNDIMYLSLSLDVFSPAYAPGVSIIQPLGLNPWHVIPLLRQAAGSGKVISYDIAELVPRYDIDHRTSKLAAVMVYEIIHHHREFKRAK